MLNQPFVKQIDLRGFNHENLEQFLSDINNAVFANPDILKKVDELNTKLQSNSSDSLLTQEELDKALKTFDDGLSSLSDIFKSFEQKNQNNATPSHASSSFQSQSETDNVHCGNLNSKNQSKESNEYKDTKESKDTFDSLAEMYRKNKEKEQRQGRSHHTYFEQQDKSKVELQTKDNKRTSRNVDRINIGALNEFRNRQQMSEDYANSLNNSNNQNNVEHEDASAVNTVRETIVNFGNHNNTSSGEVAASSVHQSDNSDYNNDIKDNEMTNTNDIENVNASVAVDNEICTKQEQEYGDIGENETNSSSEYSATPTSIATSTAMLTERLESVIPKLLKVAKDIDNAKIYEEVAQSLSKLEKIDNASPSYINYVTHVRDKIQENQSRQTEIVNLIELIEELV